MINCRESNGKNFAIGIEKLMIDFFLNKIEQQKYLIKVARLSLLAFAGFSLFALSSAHAGFEWTPPNKLQTRPMTPLQPLAGPAETFPMGASVPRPAPINGEMVRAIPVQRNMLHSTQPPSLLAPTTHMGTNAPLSMRSTPPTPQGFENVTGFGRDMPLLLALKQIVPDNYTYSVAPHINQGTSLSWDGGAPWDQVLNDALSPLGLTSYVDGKTVRIGQIGRKQIRQNNIAPPPIAPVPPMAMASAPMMPPVIPAQQIIPSAPQPFMMNTPPFSPAIPLSAAMPLNSLPRGLDIAPSYTMPGNDIWYAEKGQSLRYVLTNWSNMVGAQILWNAPRDYQLPIVVKTGGSYTTAVETILNSFVGDGNRPVGELYKHATGTTVLVITEN